MSPTQVHSLIFNYTSEVHYIFVFKHCSERTYIQVHEKQKMPVKNKNKLNNKR